MESSGVFSVCYKTFLCFLKVVQRITKCQKVYVSSQDEFPNFITSTLLNIGPKVSQSRDRVVGIHLFLNKY